MNRLLPVLGFCFLVLMLQPFHSVAQEKKRPAVRRITEFQTNAKGIEVPAAYQVFSPQGWLLEEAEFDETGKLKSRVTYEYNDQGLKTRETTHAADGKITEQRIYEYDAYGNRLRRTVMDGTGRIKSVKRMEYEYFH